MKKTALITGASSGLGAEYAKALAKKDYNLVLVARDKNALDKVANSLQTEVEVISADLLKADELLRVRDRLKSLNSPIEMLINNAGFGLDLNFADNDLEDEINHLRLHNEIPLTLMHDALQGMRKRRSGTIINVASVAAFIPRSTYSAAKQWLVTFSRWANNYYGADGVTVTAVCPGFTHTNFHERMGLAPGKEGVPGWMWLNAEDVIRQSLADSKKGKAVSIPSFKYKMIVFLTRFIPASIASKAGEKGR